MTKGFSFYKPGYGFINHFYPKYAQGDTVYIVDRKTKKLKRGTISGAQLDQDMNFIAWRVSVPSYSIYVYKKDPNCPWNK